MNSIIVLKLCRVIESSMYKSGSSDSYGLPPQEPSQGLIIAYATQAGKVII